MIRDRVKEFRRVRASELRKHAGNWRRHPDDQAAALRRMLEAVGFAGAVLARECEGGGLELIDGHLRVETMGDEEVPVLVVDLNEEESSAVLATYDALGEMAEGDKEAQAALLDEVGAAREVVESVLAEKSVGEQWLVPEARIPHSFEVVVECEGEADQRKVFEAMRKAGYPCRVLTL